jgi:hypothetical protein
MVSWQHVTHSQAQRLAHPSPDLMQKKKKITRLRCGNRLHSYVLYGSLSLSLSLSTASTERLYGRDGECLLRGTDWVFNYESV